ncbi:MAG: nucleoside deaminase [Paludibacteraceae bacterium]|nr:nucleoside deaminase [Paludibacteraceae bacterium]
MQHDDTYYMKQALLEAQKAYQADEVPVGAVVVAGGRIVGRGHNLTETLSDATAHAEMIALTAAMNELGAKYLPDCTIYVTVEPCVMCAGAMYWAKIAKLVYGASEDKYGFTVKAPTSLHPKTEVVCGVLQEECAQLMKDFFKAKR